MISCPYERPILHSIKNPYKFFQATAVGARQCRAVTIILFVDEPSRSRFTEVRGFGFIEFKIPNMAVIVYGIGNLIRLK
jgi:hypothetical protein